MTSRIFKILFIAVSVVAIFSGLCANESRKAKYIFLMIGDGMGSNHRAIASTYLKATTNRKMINPWPQDLDGVITKFSRLGGLLNSYQRVKAAA